MIAGELVDVQDDLLGGKIAPGRHVGERASERARGGDAGARRGRLRAGGLGEEEGNQAVADVSPDEATRVDDGLIGDAGEAAREREVAGRGQATTRCTDASKLALPCTPTAGKSRSAARANSRQLT